MKENHRSEQGFTLLELMITVTVIGILAAVAIPSYQRYIRDVKMQEARTTLPQIRLKEQVYYLEFRQYLSAAAHPTMPCEGSKSVWGTPPADWQNIGFRPPTPGVYFRYSIVAGNGTAAVPTQCPQNTGLNLHYPNSGDWFYICAQVNLGTCGTTNAIKSFGMSGSETINHIYESQ